MKAKSNLHVVSLLQKKGISEIVTTSLFFLTFYLTRNYISGYVHHISIKVLLSLYLYIPFLRFISDNHSIF